MNKNISIYIENIIKSGKVGHAFLIAGGSEAMRGETEEMLLSALMCEGMEPHCGSCSACRKVKKGIHPDVTKINADEKSSIKVEDIRRVIRTIYQIPSEGKRSIVLIQNAERITPEGYDALLKALEEPPSHVVFVLSAKNKKALIETVLSRVVTLNLGEDVEVTAVCPEATQIAAALSKRDEFSLLSALIQLEKTKREQFLLILSDLSVIIRNSLMTMYHMDTSDLVAAELSKAYSVNELLELSEVVSKMVGFGLQNVSTANMIGYMLSSVRV